MLAISHTFDRAQVTLIEPGSFKTEGQARLTVLDALPAYTGSPANVVRQELTALANAPAGNDPRNAVELFYHLASLPQPPLHFPIGKDAIEAVRNKAANLLAETEEYAPWTKALEATEES